MNDIPQNIADQLEAQLADIRKQVERQIAKNNFDFAFGIGQFAGINMLAVAVHAILNNNAPMAVIHTIVYVFTWRFARKERRKRVEEVD